MRGGSLDAFNTNPSTSNTPTYPAGVGGRKKGVGVRSWLVLNSSGQSQLKEDGKHAIMRRTGLPVRDLRILDPLLSYPSTVLGRERAIVVSLEHIKAIITAQEVLLLNSEDPSVTPFVQGLQTRILYRHHHATTKPKPQEELQNSAAQGEAAGTPQSSSGGDQLGSEEEAKKKDAMQSIENKDGSKLLPFEFVALEACLEAAISSLEHEASRLELEAHSALDKLTSKISNLSSERVRQIKSRLVAITGRVHQVRDVLEHLLDDDEDMAEMYLTEKLLAQKLEDSSMNESETSCEVDLPQGDELDDRDEIILETDDLLRNADGIRNKLDVKELERVLEAYFVQIDGTLNKLSTLREYVEDTEDYIKTMLDEKQNHLLQMGVVLTTATLVMSAFIAVASVFGMNIHIELFDVKGSLKFIWTVIGCSLGSLFLYFGAIGWFKYKRLLL